MEIRKKGKWQVDWVKYSAIGIPLLYLVIFPLVWTFSIKTQGSQSLLNFLFPPALNTHLPNTLSGVVFGYILLSMPYKVDSDESIQTEKVTIND